MNSVPALRFMALAVLSGALAALVLGGWAFAQNIPLPAPLPNTGPAPATNTAPDSALAPAGSSNTNALNWAGYVATGGTYTSVSGTWTVPKVQDGTTGDVADATWVGIGGVASTDLIQAGTEAIPDSSGGIVYQAWMELLPQDSKVVPLAVSPGDVVSVSITEGSPGVWEVSFNDATSGKSFQTAVRYDSSLSSADWIEEMPVEVGGAIGLDDFGTIRFENGYAIKNGEPVTIQSSGATPLTMDNAYGEAVATPTVLAADGSSFDISRTAAVSTPLALAGDGFSAVSIDPNAFSGFGSGGGYATHHHRGGGYRIVVSF